MLLTPLLTTPECSPRKSCKTCLCQLLRESTITSQPVALEPILEEPALLPLEQDAPVVALEASHPAVVVDEPPRPVCFSKVMAYMKEASPEEQDEMKAFWPGNSGGFSTQVTRLPRPRSFSSQTAPPKLLVTSNPDGTVRLEHESSYIRVRDTMVYKK